MSRNFELLSQVGRMHELVQSQLEPLPMQAEGMPAAMEPPPMMDASAVAVAETPVEEQIHDTPSFEMSGTVRDEISKLVQNLFLGQQGSRRVVFSGIEPGCGATFTCAHAADWLAQTRGTVCVVDCNLRSPGLHEQFGKENHHGLSDALMGAGPIREFVHRISRNLWLLSCGSSAEAAQNLMSSERMRSRMSELRGTFDYVLIDAAPLNASNDAIVLGGQSDGVVLMLKANSSRREAARKAVQELQAANVRTLGAVLNQRTFPIPEKIYRAL